MRKLMWFTIGFGASCVFGSYIFSGWVLLAIAAAAGAMSLAALLAARKYPKLKPLPVLLLALGLGMVWFYGYDQLYLMPAKELDGVTTKAIFEASDYSFDAQYGSAVDGAATWEGRTYRVRIYLDGEQQVKPGDLISGSFRFRYTHTGGEKDATYHRGEGILLLAYVRGEASIQSQNAPWWRFPAAHIRLYLQRFLEETFPEDTFAFAKALLLGDDEDIDYETNTAFRLSGIRHIIAVSGLHVSILFAVIYFISGKRPLLTFLLGVPLLMLFAAVAGLSPSVLRACLMHALMMAAMLFHKEYDPPSALSFAALCMLVVNPLVSTSVSFQLSVGCMAGIFLFASEEVWNPKKKEKSPKKSAKARVKQVISQSVSVSLGAISLTTPLSALYFGCISLVSVLSNLLTLWVVTIAFYGIILVCVFGLIWKSGAAVLAWLVSWPIRYILWMSKLLASFPVSAVYTRSVWIIIWLIFVFALFGLFLLLRRKHPVVLSCFAVIGLCAALLISWMQPLADEVRMTVLDVGQGQSIILQHGRKTFLVDCGGDYADSAADTAAETLLSMGINRIDGLVLTHYDADHAGGAPYLLSRIPADVLYLPAWTGEGELYEKITGYSSGEICYVEAQITLRWDDGNIVLIPSNIEDSTNESSLCVLFQAANCDILITGDRGTLGEKLLLRQIDLPKLDVLVAGHHGSKFSTGEELLAATTPQIVVISVDRDNRYGHPAQEVLDRIEKIGSQIYRTDIHGTVIIRR